MVMEQVILENLACRSMPVILPHELIPWLLRHGLHPTIPDHSTIEYWNHIGEPEHSDANPLWIWGDGSQYLESGESITVVCFGMVLQRQLEKTTVKRCFPIFLYREEATQLFQYAYLG